MTIAARFLHANGVLLCSDTQQESGAAKFHDPKVGVTDIPYGRIAFAFAGHCDFATTAMADEGPDHPRKVIALYPNYHRRVHYGLNGRAFNQKLRKRVATIEALLEH